MEMHENGIRGSSRVPNKAGTSESDFIPKYPFSWRKQHKLVGSQNHDQDKVKTPNSD